LSHFLELKVKLRDLPPEPTKIMCKKTETKYTWAEVKKHITPEDAWVVHNNKVYDVSNW